MKYTNGSPLEVAATRAVVSALVVGGLGLLAAWTQTTETKELVIAFGTPALTTIAMRLGVEGRIDAKK